LAFLACLPAQAESQRCTGGITAEGSSRISVACKCGLPVSRVAARLGPAQTLCAYRSSQSFVPGPGLPV